MMTQIFLAPSTRGRWFKIGAALVFLAARLAAAPSQDLASLVKVYRDTPSVARRRQIELFASAHAKDQNGALARLALGITSAEQKDYARAIENLKAAQARGDFQVLAERGRRALRLHLGPDVKAGLATVSAAVKKALR